MARYNLFDTYLIIPSPVDSFFQVCNSLQVPSTEHQTLIRERENLSFSFEQNSWCVDDTTDIRFGFFGSRDDLSKAQNSAATNESDEAGPYCNTLLLCLPLACYPFYW